MNRNGFHLSPGLEWVVFLRRFVRSPRTVGAIAPSSRSLADRMVEDVEFLPGVKLVEFGPGTGALTQAIVDRLPAEGRYLGIERDPVFVEVLRRRWPHLNCACDSVENLLAIAEGKGFLPVDHIVSGLPFASLPAATTVSILDAVRDSLRRGGTFTTFQYVHAYPMRSAVAFRGAMKSRLGPPIRRRLVCVNLPPAFVITWSKRS